MASVQEKAGVAFQFHRLFAGGFVDLEQKTATAITGGAGIHWISKDTLAFSREVPDSDLRGT